MPWTKLASRVIVQGHCAGLARSINRHGRIRDYAQLSSPIQPTSNISADVDEAFMARHNHSGILRLAQKTEQYPDEPRSDPEYRNVADPSPQNKIQVRY